MDAAPPPVLPRRRRFFAPILALALAAVGLAPAVVARASGPAGAAPAASSTPSTPSTMSTTSTTAAPADPTTTVPSPVNTAPTLREPTRSTTGATSAPTTTTTTATTTTAPATRSAAAPTPVTRSAAAATPLQQVEAIADAGSFDWRAAGVVIHIAFHPDACCHWGIYDFRDNSLWIGPTAFASPTRLRYVVLHELGHAWQEASGRRGTLAADMAPWGHSGNDALEYSADCIATVWGARMDNYWACPVEAQELVRQRLAGDWS